MLRLKQLIQNNPTITPAIRVESSGDVANIYLFDVIDSYWGVSAKMLVEALTANTDKEVNLHINSPGGDVFEARAMKAAIAAHPKAVHALIEGVCASAATSIANACSSVSMTSDSLYMIHESWTFAMGNKSELAKTASLLEKVDGQILAEYVAKTGGKESDLRAAMEAETWYTGEEAVSAGFADKVVSATKQNKAWDLSAYAKAPKQPEPEPKEDFEGAVVSARNRLRLFELL